MLMMLIRKKWFPPLFIGILVLVLWVGEYTRRELWEPDEARYAYVAREMRDTRSWFIPRLYGEPYPDKPPMLFWLMNLSATIFTNGEINGVSARLPSMLGCFLSLLTLFYLVVRWDKEVIAWCSVLVLATTFLFWNLGGWGRTDALLCGFEMLSLYFFFTSGGGRYFLRIVCAYIFAGLAMLVKGPVGLIVPLGIYAVSEYLWGNYEALKRFHWIWGTLIAVIFPGIWLLLAYLNGASWEYFQRMLGEKLFARVVESKGHAQPFYYFLLHLPAGFMPWSIFVPSAITAVSNKRIKLLVLGWAGFVVLFFSLFVCKRHIYILPAYPALALLVGAGWMEFEKLSERWKLFTAIAGVGFLCLSGICEIGVYFWFLVPSGLRIVSVIFAGSFVLIAGVILGVLYKRYSTGIRWCCAYALVLFIHYGFLGTFVLPGLNYIKTPPAEFRQTVQIKLKPDQPVHIFNDQLAIIPFYAKRHGKTIHNIEELKEVMKKERTIILVTTERQWNDIRAFFPDNVEKRNFRMGDKNIVWIEYSNSVINTGSELPR
jgi:4-amino-4-deoxy-L-arabinose transferase-like glycosyltransferase